jgi:AcrR family transcriptional regulator
MTTAEHPPERSRRSDGTRAAILAAARRRFAADGYDRATIRAIAAEASIDPSMVMRYYGSKENLFAVAARFELDLPDLGAVPRDRLGEAAVRLFVDRWDGPAPFPILLRAALTNEAAADRLRAIFRDQVATALAATVPPDELAERAALVATQIIGLATCRYVLRLDPIATMSPDRLVTRYAPTLQHYLTTPLD